MALEYFVFIEERLSILNIVRKTALLNMTDDIDKKI